MIYFIIAIQAVIVVGAVVTVVRLVRRRRLGLNTAEALGVPSMPRAMLRMLLIIVAGVAILAGVALFLIRLTGHEESTPSNNGRHGSLAPRRGSAP